MEGGVRPAEDGTSEGHAWVAGARGWGYHPGMSKEDKPVQPGPSFNAVQLPGMARTDHAIAPSNPMTTVAPVIRVDVATETEVVSMLADSTRFAGDPELRMVAGQLLAAGYTVREVCRKLKLRPHVVWGWAEEPVVKTAIEKGKDLRRKSLGQELEHAAENALATLVDLMGDAATTPKDRLKAAELILDRCGLVDLKQVAQVETAVKVDIDFDERLARIVAASRPA